MSGRPRPFDCDVLHSSKPAIVFYVERTENARLVVSSISIDAGVERRRLTWRLPSEECSFQQESRIVPA